MKWQCFHKLVLHILALKRGHAQFRKNRDHVHICAIVEHRNACCGLELKRMPPVGWNAEDLASNKRQLHGFRFMKIRLVRWLRVPCADG